MQKSKRAQEGSKIKVLGLSSNQVHVEDLIVVITMVRTVRQTESVCEIYEESKFRVDLGDWAGLRRPQFGHFMTTGF